MHVVRIQGLRQPAKIEVVWAHGWGHTHEAFVPLALDLRSVAQSILFDFPGFGLSTNPTEAWGTVEYADAAALHLVPQPFLLRVWVGHSFGCRVGLQLAARHPGLVDAMCLIAAAGLPRKRGLARAQWIRIKKALFRVAMYAMPTERSREHMRKMFGSRDYRAAGPLRPTLSRVVSEDLTPIARQVTCPVLLIYGDGDAETPVELGERFARLIPNASLIVLKGFDHNSILSAGHHELVGLIRLFLEQLLPR